MAITSERITAEQFFALEGDMRFHELIDGVIVVNEPLPHHGAIVVALILALGNWTKAGPGRGRVYPPADVLMTERNVFKPDVLWIAEANLPADDRVRLQRVPDLCVEVRSRSTWRYDVGYKLPVYQSRGVPELWLVDDIAESILVYRRSTPKAATFDVALELSGDDVLSSPQLPGFGVPVAEIFRAA